MKILTRTGCGYQRFQCRHAIRAALLKRGLSMSQLARLIGVSAEAVSSTVLGKKHCPQVLDALKHVGVPERYLFDPRQDDTRAA